MATSQSDFEALLEKLQNPNAQPPMASFQPPVANPMASFQPQGMPMPPTDQTDDSDAEEEAPKAAAPSQPSAPVIQGPDTPITATGPQAPSDYQALIAKLSQPDQSLIAAQEQARQNQMGVGIGQALASGIGQMTGSKPNNELYAQLAQNANAPVNNILTQRKAQSELMQNAAQKLDLQQKMSDMDSNNPMTQLYSKMLMDSASKAGIDLKGVMPANPTLLDIEKASKIIDPVLNRQIQLAAVQATKENTKVLKGQAAGSEYANKVLQTQSRGALANAWKTEQRLDNIYSLLNEPGDKNEQQVKMLAAEIAGAINNGQVTEAGQKEILPPSTIVNKMQGILTDITNKPQSAKLEEFLKTYKPYIDELRTNASRTLGEGLSPLRSAYKGRVDSDTFNEINRPFQPYFDAYEKHSARPSFADAKQSPSPTAPAANPNTDRINAYAQKYNLPPDQAAAILKSRGVIQ